MHFLREACRRKPFEPKGLAYSRAATAIIMCSLYLAYIGYLISELYYDNPLIIQSTENMPDNNYPPVDIYICAEGSTITFNNCSYINKDYDPVYLENCEKHFKFKSLTSEQSCYMFMADESYNMYVSEYSDENTVRSFDFYWTADNLTALYDKEISVPTVSIQLYDMAFNPHRPWGIGNTEIERKERMYLGQQVPWSSCAINQSTTIHYFPLRKFKIKPADFRAFLGLKPNYIELNEAQMQQIIWPISDITPEHYPKRSTYQGEISVQISTDVIAIQTDQRQHTFLAEVALAGGSYGLLTTLYVLLFGMNKLTPWGLVHNTTSMFSRPRRDKNDKNKDIEYNNVGDFDTDGENIQPKPSIFSSFTLLFGKRQKSNSVSRYNPRKNGSQQHFRNQETGEEELNISRPESPSRTNLVDRNDEILMNNLQRKSTDISIQSLSTSSRTSRPGSAFNQSKDKNLRVTITRRYDYSDSEDELNDQQDQDSPVILRRDKRTKDLEDRVDELETILSQFFIDTSYLRDIRSKEQDNKKKPAN